MMEGRKGPSVKGSLQLSGMGTLQSSQRPWSLFYSDFQKQNRGLEHAALESDRPNDPIRILKIPFFSSVKLRMIILISEHS